MWQMRKDSSLPTEYGPYSLLEVGQNKKLSKKDFILAV